MTKSNVAMIDKWLADNGCRTRFAIGGGAAEDGSGALFTYFMDEETKTNETGKPLEPYIKAKIIKEGGMPARTGERGILHISSPRAADRYLCDENATRKRWYTGEDGLRWGNTGDIAVRNPDGSYNILGRGSDSCIDADGRRIFLFDIENSMEPRDPMIEWEITAFSLEKGRAVVGQVVLKNEWLDKKARAVEYLCEKYGLDGVKFYQSFDVSDVTGKRDFQKLRSDREGYLRPYDRDRLVLKSWSGGRAQTLGTVYKKEI